MRGIPKHFNTVDDVFHSLAEDREGTKAKLQMMLDGRFVWQQGEQLADADLGITDNTHKVLVLTEKDTDGVEQEVTYQYELVEDPNAWLFQVGLTVDRVKQILGA